MTPPQAPSNLVNVYTCNTELSEEFSDFLVHELFRDPKTGLVESWNMLNFLLGYGQ